MISYVYALDGKMEIYGVGKNIPTVLISVSQQSQKHPLAHEVKKIIKKDLEVSGHFKVKNKEFIKNYYEKPTFVELKKENIDLFLNIYLETTNGKDIAVNMKLYDINKDELVAHKKFISSNIRRYPFLSHKIAIQINQYLKAPSINWMDRLVVFSRYTSAGESEIVISDYTLTYQKIVVRGGYNLFPKWADNDQTAFYYTSNNGFKPLIKKQSLYTNKSENIISSAGMAVVSDVSRIGTKIILTLAPNDQPDIYIYDTATKLKTRLTNYKGIDVNGSFVENDTKVVFVSDRLRKPNIFAKKLGQRGVERLVYHGKSNTQATTFNDYVVYASRESNNEFSKNTFNLYLISTQSDFIKRLTTKGRNQFPKFSQDGDSILYIKNYNGKSSLGIIRVNYNKNFLFTLKSGKLQSIDW
jgi:TolB protein